MREASLKPKVYAISVLTVGSALCLLAALNIFRFNVGSQNWLLFAGAVLTVGTHEAIKLNRLRLRFRLNDAFTLTMALLFGAFPATLTAAASALLIAFQTKCHRRDLMLRPGAAALSLFTASAAATQLTRWGGQAHPFHPLMLLCLMAFVYTLCNDLLLSIGVALEENRGFGALWYERWPHSALSVLIGGLGAIVVYGGIANLGFYAFVIVVPILFIAYFTYQTYLNKIEATNQHVSRVAELYLSTIESLTMAIDAKDQITHGHVRRVRVYALELAQAAGYNSDSELEGLKAAALLHDIGKLAIPEYILNKPGQLTTAEFNKMTEHPMVAAELLKNVDFPYPVVPLVLHHHEKWNGTGYPAGLQGEEIPFGARILSIVDCYDALRSDRPYRRGFAQEKTLGIMAKESGTTFDPMLLQRFFKIVDRCEEKVSLLGAPHTITVEPVDAFSDTGSMAVHQTGSWRRPQSVYENIAAAHQEVVSLYDITQSLSSTLNISELLSLVASKLGQIVGFDTCVVYLADNDECTLKATHIIGDNVKLLSGYVIRYGDGISGWVAANREPMAGANPQSDFTNLRDEALGKYTNSLVFPLVENGEVLGVLSLYATEQITYADDHVRLMELVAKHAATALRNVRKFEETQESALTDRLTGLPNSRYMYLFIEQELAKAARHDYPVTLLMMDLDGFKRVNDLHGHPVGDDLLRDLAKVLNGQIRRDDILVRYAGDEFIAVLIGTTKTQTDEVINRIQGAVDNYSLMIRGGKSVSVGISIGKAVFPDSGTTLEELMVIADANMYRNKDERRDHQSLMAVRATS